MVALGEEMPLAEVPALPDLDATCAAFLSRLRTKEEGLEVVSLTEDEVAPVRTVSPSYVQPEENGTGAADETAADAAEKYATNYE